MERYNRVCWVRALPWGARAVGTHTLWPSLQNRDGVREEAVRTLRHLVVPSFCRGTWGCGGPGATSPVFSRVSARLWG